MAMLIDAIEWLVIGLLGAWVALAAFECACQGGFVFLYRVLGEIDTEDVTLWRAAEWRASIIEVGGSGTLLTLYVFLFGFSSADLIERVLNVTSLMLSVCFLLSTRQHRRCCVHSESI